MVESVFLPDPAKGIRSGMVIATEQGQSFFILVEPTTTIYDISQGPIDLEAITSGNTVKVKYMSPKKRGNEALSIYLMKH